MDDINFIKDQKLFGLKPSQLEQSIILEKSNSSQSIVKDTMEEQPQLSSPRHLQNRNIYQHLSQVKQVLSNPVSSSDVEESISLVESSGTASNHQADFTDSEERKVSGNASSSSEIDALEEEKVESYFNEKEFEEKRKLQLSEINDKYEQQVRQLELRGMNRKIYS